MNIITSKLLIILILLIYNEISFASIHLFKLFILFVCEFVPCNFLRSVFLLQGLKTAKQIEALVYSETSAKTSEKSVKDVLEVAALSSVGSQKSDTQFKRQKSFIKRKRFSGMREAKSTLREESTKSCVIM